MSSRIFSFFLLSSLVFVGCKKEETVLEKGIQYSGAPEVSFNNYGGYQKVNVEYLDQWDTLSYQIKLSNTTGVAKAPITITLVKDDNPISEYNTANGTTIGSIPVNGFKFIDNVVTMAKGSRITSFRFAINPVKLGGNRRAFGVSILTVEGGGATVNNDDLQSRLVVEIGAVNDYDGVYSLKGAFLFHPTYAGPFNGATIELQTSGPRTVDQFSTDFGEYCQPFSVTPGNPTDLNRFAAMSVKYTVDPSTNAVSVAGGPGNGTVIEPIPTYPSRYVPGLKTMYVSWGYKNAAGALRQFIDTLTFIRKR